MMNRTQILLAAMLFLQNGCLEAPIPSKGAATLSENNTPQAVQIQKDENGVLTAVIDANSGSSQLMTASEDSGIAGSRVIFPPGTLGISTDVTIEEGVALASDTIANELGVSSDAGLKAASATVVISSSQQIDATQPFTVGITLSSAQALHLTQAKK